MCPLSGWHLQQVKEQQVSSFTFLTGVFKHQATPETHHFTFALSVVRFQNTLHLHVGLREDAILSWLHYECDAEKFWGPWLAFPPWVFCIWKVPLTLCGSFLPPMFKGKKSFHYRTSPMSLRQVFQTNIRIISNLAYPRCSTMTPSFMPTQPKAFKSSLIQILD